MPTFSIVIGIGALLIASSAIAQPPAPAGDAPQPGSDPQAQVNEILNQSLGAVDECYQGVHRWFNDDLIARALDAVLKKVGEPGGVCEQYQKHAAELPLEIGNVPLLPGVTLDTKKLCELLQHPRCPE